MCWGMFEPFQVSAGSLAPRPAEPTRLLPQKQDIHAPGVLMISPSINPATQLHAQQDTHRDEMLFLKARRT